MQSKTSNYLISLDEEDTSRNSGNYFGKLRSNFVGTEFTLFDKGAKPGKSDNTVRAPRRRRASGGARGLACWPWRLWRPGAACRVFGLGFRLRV